MRRKVVSLAEAAGAVRDGALIGLMSSKLDGAPLAFVRELVRQGRRELRAVTRGAGLACDLLIGAGVLRELETCSMDLAAYGPAPHFQRAIRGSGFRMKDTA
jgi:glutaconate CoA-transferase subunit A